MRRLFMKGSNSEVSVSDIEIKQLSVGYDEKEPALWDLNFSLPKGALVGIFGPNGAGKSTLVKTAVGLLRPIYGGIFSDGKPLNQLKGGVGYVPQKNEVDWSFPATAQDVVLMGSYARLGAFRLPGKKERLKAQAALKRVEMAEYSSRPIQNLSEGQKQRVFIARALMQESDLYFMDEPFAGIDLASEQVIQQILCEMRDAGKTIILVHHDLKGARELFDWLVFLNMRLVASGPTNEVLREEVIEKTYGRSQVLFQQATELAKERASGVV